MRYDSTLPVVAVFARVTITDPVEKPVKIWDNDVMNTIIAKENSEKESDIVASQSLDVSSIDVVCLMWGPYRNLTTLTAAVLFLHPQCQVLNHAGIRIFDDDRLDFLKQYSTSRFDAFLRYATYISQKGGRGQVGGSITFSHAFDPEHTVRETFAHTGQGLLKKDIRALFWKESMLTTNHLRTNNVAIDSLLAASEKIKFLMPVRHPLDCAESNIKTGHIRYLFDADTIPVSKEQVTRSILQQLAQFKTLHQRYPDRFFYYFSNAVERETFTDMAAFLGLDDNEEWPDSACAAYTVKQRNAYTHSAQDIAAYKELVHELFEPFPDMLPPLLAFVE